MKARAKLAELRKKTAVEHDGRYRIRVGMATCGLSAGAGKVYDAFAEAVKESGLTDADVVGTGCVGRCDLEPMAEVARGGEPPVLYVRLDPDKARRIVAEHLVDGTPVEEYAE